MNALDNLNEAIMYMEHHLSEELNYDNIAAIANCPAYYFQKLFLYMTSMTIHEYIRLRRLSLAAVDLQKNNAKVIDVAFKYGYSSPTAFHRAFKNFHGIAPSLVKKKNATFRSYPPLKFSMTRQGGQELHVQIVNKEAFRILGIPCPLDRKLEKNFENIPTMWDKAVQDGKLSDLTSLMNSSPQGLLGVSLHHEEEWNYFIAVSSTRNKAPYEAYDIPACTWAIFLAVEQTNRYRI